MIKTFVKSTLRLIGDSLFPKNYRCHLCGVEIFEGELCLDCLKEVPINCGATCPVCGRKTAKNEICIECKANLPAFKQAVSPIVYEGGGAKIISAFKNGKPYLAPYFARLMKDKIEVFGEVDGIVFAPMTEKAVRRRGYNQAELIAKALSELICVPVIYGAVEKIRETPEQKALTRKERKANLDGCFKVKKPLVRGKKILVVDDVMTTGATLDELCKKLKNAGVCAVFAATAASVEYSQLPIKSVDRSTKR